MRNCLSSFPCFRISENPEIIHRKALESANSGYFENAKQLYEESIKLYKKKPENIPLAKVYSDFASLHSKMGNYDEAIECFTKSLKFFEKDGCSFLDISKVKLKIASCYFEKGELTQASSFIEGALEVAGDQVYSNNHRNLVAIYRNAGDLYEKMQSKYKESLTPPLPPLEADSSLFVPRQIHVENPSSFKGTENTQQGSENNYFSKHIDCLQKAVHFSCNIFLKDEKKRIDLYDIPNPDDENNFLIICSAIEKAFNEIHNLVENHKLNAELGVEYKKTLMESLDKLIDVSTKETVAESFSKLVEESSLIYERLTPFFKDTKIETPPAKTSPTKIEITSSSKTSSRDDDKRARDDKRAGVFNPSR